ncbi:MAG TPA: hypothetical protein ENN67_02315 [Firmicutes bacterium]|nr:hypothetical protein [Bacillota bacterium]
MLKISNLTYSIIALSIGAIILLGVVACGNNGPIAPDSNLNPSPDPVSPDMPLFIDDRTIPNPDETADTLDPQDTVDEIEPVEDIGAETIQDLAVILFHLQESGGGVLSVPMEPDRFAIHLWDPDTFVNLQGEVVVVSTGLPTALVTVNGYQLFQNVAFPISVTVKCDGYAMTSIVDTSANVLSFPMRSTGQPEKATVFGIAKNFGFDTLQVYSDTLMPFVSMEQPSEVNPEYTRFELDVDAGKINGFSAFLTGCIQNGTISTTDISSPDGYFWVTSHFEWSIPSMKPGTRRFYPITFKSKSGPDGVAQGKANIPAEYWVSDVVNHGTIAAIPTAIFLQDRRYLPIGPYSPFTGNEASELSYEIPYFNPVGAPDRIVMAGHMVLPTGEINIVHRDWHPGYDPDILNFSGVPSINMYGGPGEGWSYPAFSWTDPIGANSTLTRIDMIGGNGAWRIITAGNGSVLDTSNLDIPLSWFPEIFGYAKPRYRVECIHADGSDIDDFNDDRLIMMRREASCSVWSFSG